MSRLACREVTGGLPVLDEPEPRDLRRSSPVALALWSFTVGGYPYRSVTPAQFELRGRIRAAEVR